MNKLAKFFLLQFLRFTALVISSSLHSLDAPPSNADESVSVSVAPPSPSAVVLPIPAARSLYDWYHSTLNHEEGAFEHLEGESTRENHLAQGYMAILLEEGEGIFKKNHTRAVALATSAFPALLELSASEAHIEEKIVLGKLFCLGLGIEQDFTRASTLLTHDHPLGLYNLGLLHERGVIAETSAITAQALFERSATLNFTPALLHLAGFYVATREDEDHQRRAQEYYTRAYELGSPQAAAHLYDFILSQPHPSNEQRERAIEYLIFACDKKYIKAMVSMANMHLYGYDYKSKTYVPYSLIRVKNLLFRVLAQDETHGEACYTLGIMYFHGEAGLEQNRVETRRLMSIAVNQPHSLRGVSEYFLGFMWEKGEGGPVDLEEARRLYELSSHRGEFMATIRLSMISIGLPSCAVQ